MLTVNVEQMWLYMLQTVQSQVEQRGRTLTARIGDQHLVLGLDYLGLAGGRFVFVHTVLHKTEPTEHIPFLQNHIGQTGASLALAPVQLLRLLFQSDLLLKLILCHTARHAKRFIVSFLV